MAIAGGAVLPLVFGKCAQHFGMQSSYMIGVVCYGVILLYALAYTKLHAQFQS